MRTWILIPTVVAALVALAPTPGNSADPPPAISELGVDYVILKRGPSVVGAVLDRSREGTLTIAVSREWLKKAHASLYETQAAAEGAQRRKALEELRDRLVPWSERSQDVPELAFFLKKETERVTKELAAPPDARAAEPQFMLLSFPVAQIERVQLQTPQRKKVALLAWREQLANVEKRSATDLARELQRMKLDPAREQVDLYDRLPPSRQSDAEWAARQALAEYQYQKRLDFQGTGDFTFRTGDGAAAPPAGELLGMMLKEQLSRVLSDLLEEKRPAAANKNDTKWLDTCINTAERERARGFRVTRVALDMTAGRVEVETRFVARMPAGTWETVWRHAETVDAARADKDRVDRIRDDPQVKEMLDRLKGVGQTAGQDQMEAALRMGAATMQAQQSADGQFYAFRDRYLERLDGPLLKLPDGPVR